MKRNRSALVAGTVAIVALLVGMFIEAENIVAEQPLSWSHLALLSFVAFLGMVAVTYRILPEPDEPQEGDSYDG